MMGDLSLTRLALELLTINEDFYCRLKDPQHHSITDFELYDFNQTWSSTALGFGGIRGQTFTSARTYVFIPIYTDGEDCIVYFTGRYAYSVPLYEKGYYIKAAKEQGE